ncbi:Hypothetical predicted protein [Marmota monax]|uniref:c-Myc-binding protein n=1 Tax=Marmota monax TaxID=9995 RepID=A0A5E4A5S7_MARMO|nr:hypothetical protein GHT09_005468 [Marmota monax]VTJ52355.1 Hypothetical predicted protein [Marmota monax]
MLSVLVAMKTGHTPVMPARGSQVRKRARPPRMSSAPPSPPATVSGASYAAAAVTMAHYKAADSKREQFRRYLEKSGVLDTLTKVLVALYEEPEKPNSALEYPFHL